MANVKTILVDVELREGDRAELTRAEELAKASGARVFLLLTAFEQSLAGGLLSDAQRLETVRERWLAELSTWLAGQARRLEEAGIETESAVVWHSPRYDAVLARAAELQADVIVRAAHRESAIGRLLFGAADWELVRRAPQPVWIVGGGADLSKDGARVLAAVDPVHPGEQKAGLDRRLVSAGQRIVKLFGGELHIFHAYSPAATVTPVAATGHQAALPALAVGPELIEELRALRRAELDRLAEPFGVPPERVHLVAGDTKSALLECVDALRINVVLAGAVSRGRIERLLIGSTAERILDAVPCDVVVLKPHAFPRTP
ncbi:MAG TPA: universal stress protein [Woeseiaceae bacterium]